MTITIQLDVHTEADLKKLYRALQPFLLATPASPSDNGTELCSKHGVALKTYEKNGRKWKAHQTENGWCNGR